jgi:hypothetical protein
MGMQLAENRPRDRAVEPAKDGLISSLSVAASETMKEIG